ncbi:MAG: hypothetical protein ACLGP3_07060 [Acidobacteriota bacterium]
MKIAINKQDYTAALDTTQPLTIERTLNAPSLCRLWLSLPANGALPAPARMQSVAVTGDDGTLYFTGYLAMTPLPEYAGMGLTGPRYRTAIEAVSDEWLLDQVALPPNTGTGSLTAGEVLTALVTQSGSSALATQGVSLATAISNFSPLRSANWSTQAGEAAGMARASYRALNGALTLAGVPVAVHPLNETDGSLSLANLTFTSNVKRALANDVTVCGQNEPVAYVTEFFLGDGVTTKFTLAEDPYVPPAGKTTIIHELWNEPAIDSTRWSALGGAGYLTLGSGGLAMNGGNGRDGQTVLTWLEPVEMGGTLLMEAVGVTLAAGSSGIVAGFFLAPETAGSCTAGFQVTSQSGSGTVTLQPLIQGSAAGTPFTANPANQYTLRVRVHCPECERSQSLYYSYGDAGAISAGGMNVLAPGQIQMEVQEFVNGVGAMPVTLYDGAVASLPGFCLVVPASSLNLNGAMRAFNLTNLGSGWVVSTPQAGGPYTRRVGSTAEAAECHVERTGFLVFYPGSVPAAGEQIAVSYRTIGRAVGRAVNAASQQALAAAGAPPVAAWIGTVTTPPARSSADCRAAARVMVQAAAGASALWSGAYKGTRASFAADVWPGDALALNAPSTGLNAQVVVRTVKVTYAASLPDLVIYEVAFANDWADDLAIKTSTTVPENAWLPALCPGGVQPAYLANLNALAVTALSGSSVTVQTGAAPPTGGGFEIRSRENAFMPGEDPTLVMRSAAQTLTFARMSWCDRFYVRMYDGATPPNYSEFSAAIFVNLPLT